MYSDWIENFVTNPENFNFLGFTIVRGVLSKDEVIYFRKFISDNFVKLKINGRMLLPSHVMQIPQLYQLSLRQKVVDSLKCALGGSYRQFCDYNLRKNCFGGWHVDSGSEKGESYLLDKNYRFVKCGIFFQNNSKEYGGGIDFRLFSHKFLYNRLPKIFKIFLSRLYFVIKNKLSHQVIINPGDMVFFDSRLEHTSSLPQSIKLSEIGEGGVHYLEEINSKYVFYWNSCSEEYWESFMNNTFKRALLEEVLPGTKEVFFTDYASRIYPEEYPENFRCLVDQCKIKIASPTKRQAMVYQKLLKSVF
jgi:hypothetical protein